MVSGHALDRHHRLDEIAALVLRRIAVALPDHLRRCGRPRRERAGPAFIRADPHLGRRLRGECRSGTVSRRPRRTPERRGGCADPEDRSDSRKIASDKPAGQQVVVGFVV